MPPPGSAQVQRGEVIELGPESRRPQDDPGGQEAAVSHPDAVGLDRGEHGVPVQDAARCGGAQGRRPDQSRHGHDALRREALAHPLLNEGDGVVAGLPVEGGLAPDRFPAGEPRGAGDLGDLIEQPDGRDPAADHDDMLAAEFVGGT